MDRARCRLYAEGANPDPGIDTISTGKIGRDIAINVVAGVFHDMAQSAAIGHTFELCMQTSGYMARAPGAVPSPVAIAAAPALAGTPPPIVLAASPIAPGPAPPMPQPPALIAPAVPLGPCGETRLCYSKPIIIPVL
jgi:hypothetical protein